MKKLLAIVVLGLLFSEHAHAKKKFILCKDKTIAPLYDHSNMKNKFFPKDGEVLTISYGKKIKKLWANDMDYIVQFTLIDDIEDYKFEFPKNVIDSSTPHHLLSYKDKTFFDITTGDTYKFLNGSLNKMTLEGFLYYKIEKQSSPRHPWSKTKDFLSISFKCKLVKPKI